MMSTQYNYAGIDIAKRNFVIGITSLQRTKTETNNPKGIAHTIEYLKKQTGSLKHQVTGLNAVKLDRQKLAQYVGQHPDAYLHEIAKHFDCTPAAVCYALKQMGMTRKKRPPLTKNKTQPK